MTNMLYVANPTTQAQRVYYRLDFNGDGQHNPGLKGASKFTDIPSGQQRPISGGELAYPLQVQDIIRQLKVFGALDVSEISGQNRSISYIFSIDKPVPKPLIERALDQNRGFMMESGRQRRIAAALGASEALNNTVAESMDADMPEPAPLSVEFEQETAAEAGQKAVAEGYDIDRAADVKSPAVRKGRLRVAA